MISSLLEMEKLMKLVSRIRRKGGPRLLLKRKNIEEGKLAFVRSSFSLSLCCRIIGAFSSFDKALLCSRLSVGDIRRFIVANFFERLRFAFPIFLEFAHCSIMKQLH